MNKVYLLLNITQNYLEIQGKFNQNLCKMADATLHLLPYMQILCKRFAQISNEIFVRRPFSK